MLESFAIIALALLCQCRLIDADQIGSVFLGQFIAQPAPVEPSQREEDGSDVAREVAEAIVLEPLPQRVAVAEPEVLAAAAFVMDAGTDAALYAKNERRQLPIASISKLMTALVVLDECALDETVIISPAAMEVFGDKADLAAGERIRLEDLLRLMLIDSNNTAAWALAEHAADGSVEAFVRRMNEKTEVLGLRDTRFFNPTGLDGQEENLSTAFDVAQLADYALERELIFAATRTREAVFTSLDGKRRHAVKNTDELLGKMDNVVGGKTGYTLDAGECLVLVSESPIGRHRVISVVLNAQDRFAETQKLVAWVFDAYRW